MTIATALPAPAAPYLRPALALLPFLALTALRPWLPEWAVTPPEAWVVPFVDWLNVMTDFLRTEPLIGDATFKDGSRAVAAMIEVPLGLLEGLLFDGFQRSLGLGIPPMPWIAVASLAGVLGWYLGGWRLALLAAGCFVYFAVVGKWKPSMQTLSVVLTAAPIAGVIGLALGVLAAKWRSFERVLWPLLNVLQSMPHFSYLIPVAVFVGVSHKGGAIATILFALPPMARLALLGLKAVPEETREAGRMAGCTPWQLIWKVELPAARDSLMVGVNQVIMQCLAMVVIASFVGAKGLGNDLLFRLQALRIGEAIEIGVAIVFMAVTLDRLSQALAAKQPHHAPEGPFWVRHPAWTAAAVALLVSIALAVLIPAAEIYPRDYALTAAPVLDAVVDYITVTFYDALGLFRDGLLVNVLLPVRDAFQYLPWVAVVTLAASCGMVLGGWSLAALVGSMVLFIVFAGFWERALITAYMVTCAVGMCVIIGLPLGMWAAGTARRAKVALFLCDTMQTFPSFIYLIPVIMLFRVGDVAAVTAIVIYATIPAVRYTVVGLRSVPTEITEAGVVSGCDRLQLLWGVRLPLAFPQIMLGINQTVLFALFMAILAAFIGTRDLGQEIFRALTFADAGKGLVIGLCVSFMGLVVDRLVGEWSAKRKRELGLAE